MEPKGSQNGTQNRCQNRYFSENGLKWCLGRASGRYQHPFGAHLGPIWERFGHDFKQILQDKFDRKKYLRHTAYSMQQLKEPSKKLQNLPQTSKDDICIHRPTRSYRRRNRRADLRTPCPKRGGGGRPPYGVFNNNDSCRNR